MPPLRVPSPPWGTPFRDRRRLVAMCQLKPTSAMKLGHGSPGACILSVIGPNPPLGPRHHPEVTAAVFSKSRLRGPSASTSDKVHQFEEQHSHPWQSGALKARANMISLPLGSFLGERRRRPLTAAKDCPKRPSDRGHEGFSVALRVKTYWLKPFGHALHDWRSHGGFSVFSSIAAGTSSP